MAYEELASVGEAVDLAPGRVLDEAEALLSRLGDHTVLRRTETTLTAKREVPHAARRGASGLRVLTVAAVPVATGGVRVSVRGNDPQGMRERRAEWAAWARGLPRLSEPRAIPSGRLPRTEVRGNGVAPSHAIGPGERLPAPEAPGRTPPRPVGEEIVEDDGDRDGENGAAPRYRRREERAGETYEYRAVPLPQAGEADRGAEDPEGEEAAGRLQAILDRHAEEGWEFCGVQAVSAGRGRGRLGAPFGGDRRTVREVVVFKRRTRQ